MKHFLKAKIAHIFAHPASRPVRKVVITLVGVFVTLLGLMLVVLPGPAFLIIPIGLGILALEYPFARVWLRKFQRWLTISANKADEFFERRRARS